MQILLTGGTGFIGSNFIEVAHKNNLKIKALSRCLNPKTKIPLSVSPNWIYKSLNETTPEDFLHVDLVVHLAAHTPQPPYDNLFNCLALSTPFLTFADFKLTSLPAFFACIALVARVVASLAPAAPGIPI